MTDNNSSLSIKYIIPFLLVIGVFFRLFIFGINPPNNAHDDHTEVVYLYSKNFERPWLFDCFECYQPPAFYYIGATVYRVSKSLGFENKTCWKLVQFINPLLSILLLLLFYKILIELEISLWLLILYLSFLVALPRDILVSAMICNDYLITFAAIASLYYYLQCLRPLKEDSKDNIFPPFLKLCAAVLLGVITKQHGLLLLLLPSSIVFFYALNKQHISFKKLLSILLVLLALSSVEEAWKFSKTGEFMVSNYDHFPNGKNQFPGSLDKVEFFSFRFISLLKEPFMTENTAASVPTELFARTFFDYEWRFLSPRTSLAVWVGRMACILGLCWLLFFVTTTFLGIKQRWSTLQFDKNSLYYLVPIMLGFLYLAVPYVQTFRMPHFSSMKAMFALPGIIILLASHALLSNQLRINSKFIILFSIINVGFTLVLLATIYRVLDTEISLDNLRGPLWPNHGG